MATIVVCSKNFTFGPTGKLLTITKPLIQGGHKVIFIGYGTAYQLASKEKFRQILNIDPKNLYFDYFTHMIIKNADLVISYEEKRIIKLAQQFGVKSVFIDSEFWCRDKISDDALSANIYLIQKTFNYKKNFNKYKKQNNLHLVEPILDLSVGKTPKKKQLIICLGGMEGGSLYKIGKDSHYPYVILRLLAKFGNFDSFEKVLITGNEKILERLSPSLKKQNSKFILKLLPHSDFLQEVAKSALVITTPGLGTILEAFA